MMGNAMDKLESALGSGLVVWGVGTARTIRVHWALAELGLTYKTNPIGARTGETKSPEFTAITARQKIPVLQDGDVVLTESLAIVAYLSDRFATDRNRLLPLDPLGRARCLEWCAYALSELDATSLYVIRRHRDLASIYGAEPAVCEAAAAYFGQQMRALDRALADGRQCIMGETFSAADIMLSSCLTLAVRYGVPVSEAAQAYNGRVTRRQAFAAATARNALPEPPRTQGASP